MSEDRLKLLFEPCKNATELDAHIREFLGIDLPWDIVDEDSTSAPLRMIWSVYKFMLTNKGESRHVVAVSRNAMKTLSASIIQFYSLVHFRRDGLIISATLDQSSSAIGYLDSFIGIPELAPYRTKSNVKNKTLQGLPPNDITDRTSATLRVATATKKGANSQRASCFLGDTLVLVDTGNSASEKVPIEKIYDRFNEGREIIVCTVNPITCVLEPSTVIGVSRTRTKELLEIKTESGKTIVCTEDHLLAHKYGKDGIEYFHAKDLFVGDQLFSKNEGALKPDVVVYKEPLTFDKKLCKEKWVYDIKVEKNHNFFANGLLAHNCLVLDEVDLTKREIISEVSYVADPTRDRNKFDPVFVYLSSRKSAVGPIQDLIDEANEPVEEGFEKDIKLHKWSVADMMEKCLPEVHLPELGPQKAYLHTETLEYIWSQETFEKQINPNSRSIWKEISAFEGCKKCSAFIVCQGRSAKQKGTAPQLRTRRFVGNTAKAVKDASMVVAQSLNWKPETRGVVFKAFAHHKHLRDPADFYEWVTGEIHNPKKYSLEKYDEIYANGSYSELADITPTKEDIYHGMVRTGWSVVAGVDWGYSPDPAVCTVAGFHKKRKIAAILHVEHDNNYANHLWAEYACKNILNRFPVELVCPDLADKASPSYFSAHGFPARDKKPARIEPGISFIRGLLWDPNRQEVCLAILDDSETEKKNNFAVEEFCNHTHAKTLSGDYDLTKFEDSENHFLDSFRYLLDIFIEKHDIHISVGQIKTDADVVRGAIKGNPEDVKKVEEMSTIKSQFAKQMADEHGIQLNPKIPDATRPVAKSRSGIKIRF